MKRLNLEDFQAKNQKAVNTDQADVLLGQVLGDCHDDPSLLDTVIMLGEGFLDCLGRRFNLTKPE